MKTFSIGFAIGASLAGSFTKSLGSARTKLTTLGEEIKGLKGKQGLIERFEKDEAVLSKARLALSKTTAELAQLKLALRKNPDDEGVAKALASTQERANKLSLALEKQKAKLHESGLELKKAAVDVKDLGGTYHRLGQALDSTRAKQARLETVMARKSAAGQRLSDLRNKVIGLGAAFYGTMQLIRESNAFEDAGVRLSTVINTTDLEKSLAASKKHALDFSRTNLATATEIIDIEYALNSAGLDESASRVGSELVAKVAKITGGAAEGVGEVIAGVFNNLGSGLEGSNEDKFKRIGELLTKTQFKFQIRNFDQLGESMKYATTAIAQNNVSLEQGVTLVGALNTAGLQGSMAGTALSASFRQMSKAAEEFGFEIERDANGQLDFIKTLENLSASIGGFEGMDQETIDRMQTAFGDEGQRAVVLLGKRLETLKAAQEDVVNGSKGLVDASYQRFLDSTSGKFQMLSNNAGMLGKVFAASLQPSIVAVVEPMTRIVGWAADMIEKMPWIGNVIAGVAAGVGAFVTVLGAVAAATWVWNAALMANPIGLIIGAAVGGAALIIANWAPISGFFKGLWAEIKSIWKDAGGLWETILSGIAISWKASPLGLLFKAGSKLMDVFSGGIKSKDSAPAKAIGDAAEKADEYMPHSDAKRGLFSRLTESGFSIGATMAEGARKGAGSLGSGLSDMFAEGSRKISERYGNLFSGIGRSPGSGGGSAGASGGIHITVAPVIHIAAGVDSDGAKQAVDRSMSESESRIRSIFEQLMHNERRLSFA